MKKEKFWQTKKFMVAISFIGLYLLSTGAAWAVFSYINQDPSVIGGDGLSGARANLADLPKTEECPINGQLYTEIERDIWSGRRPYTMVIENHADARPLEGLHKADVVYEAVAEGGITRYLGVFYCGAAAENVRVAPVRSARVYFINLAAGYGEYPIFAHWGGANNLCGDCPGGTKPTSQIAPKVNAFALLEKIGWRVSQGNDFDPHFDVAAPVFMKDYERLGKPIASEHTGFTQTDLIAEEANERGFNYKYKGVAWDKEFTPWSFVDDTPLASPKADNISFEFWSNKPDYDVTWKYDKEMNSYKKFNGSTAQTDLATGEQFTAKNVVIIFTKEEVSIDDEKHNYYEVVGDGDALVFQNGDVVEAQWNKETMFDRMLFTDEGGNDVSFVRGPVWIEVVAIGNDIDY